MVSFARGGINKKIEKIRSANRIDNGSALRLPGRVERYDNVSFHIPQIPGLFFLLFGL